MTNANIYDHPQVHPLFGAHAHVGRSWDGHPLEDDCPCDKGPCGLVVWSRIHRDCSQHAMQYAKPIRQIHTGEDCPGAAE